MKKLVSLVVLGAVVLAACGSGSNAVAATVEDQDVTVGDVESLIDTAGATLTKEQFAQFLAYQIQWLVITDVAESEYDIDFTDEEISTEADRIFEEVGEEGQSREDFLAANGVTEEFLQNIARQGLIDIAIREGPQGRGRRADCRGDRCRPRGGRRVADECVRFPHPGGDRGGGRRCLHPSRRG